MGLLYDLKNEYKAISIVGMAKNAGKTTALNYLIEEAMDEGVILGVTSTGRDGESTDLVTGTDKPRVFLDEGTIVSVPTQLYELADAGLEIIKMTDFRSSIGQIMLCRVVASGYVQIAGPVASSDTKKLTEEMLKLGAEIVIIDGAIDRKSVASPDISDAIIMSTGAVLSRSMKRVVNETAHVVGLFNLPKLEDEYLTKTIEEFRGEERILVMGSESVDVLNLKTGLNGSRTINDSIKEDTKYIYIPGAFTKSVIADLLPSKMKQVTFIVKDPTKIFIDSVSFPQLLKKGLKVVVLENIKVAAITVNPSAPSGYCFDHKELVEQMQEKTPNIPVIDVRL
ncbi:MAG: hypothetical protein RR495_00185 [Anaerovoracaceae bacterium]